MRLGWAVLNYFRFLTKYTTLYHSSSIDTLNLSAEYRAKRTKNVSVLQNFLFGRGGGGGESL